MGKSYGKDWSGATLQEIVEQLEWCGYECEAGKLHMNVAFEELKRRAEAEAHKEQD
ncbi:hypothetical protein [Paenibacillus sp. D9]|uniref:hypothetical protein n=1 Tax=Paenibacillus sp. D9 TaxID=665792 RepID=UPI000A9E785E|nr:hypothetical protein [Paenibacillus sp. D9]